MGTIVDADGYIVSKASEVENKKSLYCMFANGSRRKAKIIGIIDRHDLAMLQVDASGLTVAPFADSTKPEVGSIVATPSLGKTPVAIGIVSSKARKIKSDCVLGVRMEQINGRAVVKDVVSESAAEAAGIERGDIIRSVDDETAESVMHVVNMIGEHLPGDKVRFEVQRNGEVIKFAAKLGRFADLDEDNGDFQSYLGGELSERRSGFPSVFLHDTFLLPEHCGSPIVNLKGEVIGINIARAERIASYALPNSVLRKAIEKLKPENTMETVASN